MDLITVFSSQIPKTTLFRDKARLVEEGRLPLSFWKKRKTENNELKKSRLEEAVAACKGGKMSQAAASMTYHIPKTTIWRKLQQDGKKTERSSNMKKQQLIDATQQDSEPRAQEGSDFAYCEVMHICKIPSVFAQNIVCFLVNGENQKENQKSKMSPSMVKI